MGAIGRYPAVNSLGLSLENRSWDDLEREVEVIEKKLGRPLNTTNVDRFCQQVRSAEYYACLSIENQNQVDLALELIANHVKNRKWQKRCCQIVNAGFVTGFCKWFFEKVIEGLIIGFFANKVNNAIQGDKDEDEGCGPHGGPEGR